MRQRARWTEGRGLRGRWHAWRIDRTYPVPETWTADELHRQADRKVRELNVAIASTGAAATLKASALDVLDQAHEVEVEARQLLPDKEPTPELVTAWLNVRRQSFVRAWL